MAGNVSSFDFVLSAGVDTSAIKQDILKAYKDVQVNINGQKLTISNITIDSKNALESFKKQINNIGLSNGIKIEVDTKAFKDAQAEITRIQSLLDKTNLTTIDKAFQKNNGAIDETFKSLIKDVQLAEKELEEFYQKSNEAFGRYGKRKDQGNPVALKEYQEEYMVNQKLYNVMQQQISSLKQIQSLDGWSDDVQSLSQSYELLKSIESIQTRLKGLKYSKDFSITADMGLDKISSLDTKTIKEKYGSIASSYTAQIRGQEQILHNELNKLLEEWVNAADKINSTSINPDIQTENVKKDVGELEEHLGKLKLLLKQYQQDAINAEKDPSLGEDKLRQAEDRIARVTTEIQKLEKEIADLKIASSDFSGLTNKDLETKIGTVSGEITSINKKLQEMDAMKIDISGLSDNEMLNRIKELNAEMNDMLSKGKTNPEKATIGRTAEYQNKLSQLKLLYEELEKNKFDIQNAGLAKTELSSIKAKASVQKQIVVYSEEEHNKLIAQKNEQQSILDKLNEELKVRQQIKTTTTSATPTTPTSTTGVSTRTSGDGNGTQYVAGELVQNVKLVPDVTTFKTDAMTSLASVQLDKEVPLKVNSESINTEIQTVIGKVDELDSRIKSLSSIKFEIAGFDKLENIKNLDVSRLQVQNSTLSNITNLTYVLETLQNILNTSNVSAKISELKTALTGLNLSELGKLKLPKDAFAALSTLTENDINNLMLLAEALRELSQISALDKDLLSGIKLTQKQATNIESAATSIVRLKDSLIGFEAVQTSISTIDNLITKIATLKGVVDSVKNIKVEVIENATTGTKETKVSGKSKTSNNMQQEAFDLQKVLKLYDQYEDTLVKINALKVKKANGEITPAEQADLIGLLDQEKNLLKDINKSRTDNNSTEEQNAKLKEKQIQLIQRQKELEEEYKNQLKSEYKLSDKNTDAFNKANSIDATKYIDSTKIQTAQAELRKLYAEMSNGAKRSAQDNEALTKEFKAQLGIINTLTESSNLLVGKNGSQHMFNIGAGGNIQQRKEEILQYLDALNMGKVSFDKFTSGHQSMIISMKGSDNQIKKYKVSLDEATGAVSMLYQSEQAYVSYGSKWMAGLKKKFEQLSHYFTGYMLIMRTWSALRSGVNTIRELDKALTEMRKVSDESLSSLKSFQKESYQIASNVGATALTIQNSTADWMRLGESIEDAAESARVSNILLNVSEFEDIDSATESLVSMSQAYKELEKIDIVDKLNNVGNNFAISTDGLAVALQRSASALTTAGNDIDEAIALITAGE